MLKYTYIDIINVGVLIFMKDKNKELVVKKSNKLVEARYNWDINEQRLLLLIACGLSELKGENKNIFSCRVSELEKILEIKKFTPKYLKALCESILDKKMEISDDSGNWKIHKVLQGAEYENGELRLVLTDYIKPHLKDLEGLYTQYKLKDVVSFKSQYSIRLYEMLISVMYKTSKITIPVDELKRKFGIDETLYKRFDNFEKRVLQASVKEINEKSNLCVDYEKIKTGRTVSDLEFSFGVETRIDVENKSDQDLKYLRKYIIDLTDKTLLKLLEKYSKEDIIEKYYIMCSQTTIVTKKSAYMNKALKENFELDPPMKLEEMLFILEYAADRDRKKM